MADARFVVLGDGPERAALGALATRLALDERVRFIAQLNASDVVNYFRALDVFMLPTSREGFGMVFAEAMSQETPAIGPRMPPVDEIIVDGETGLLVAGTSADAYAAAAVALLEDSARRHAIGIAARKRVWERFDQRRSFRRIEETYRALLRARA
jgi:glycosyltransferase involved in cell wall biosynthesis